MRRGRMIEKNRRGRGGKGRIGDRRRRGGKERRGRMIEKNRRGKNRRRV